MARRNSPPEHIRQQAGRIYETHGTQAARDWLFTQGYEYTVAAAQKMLQREGFSAVAVQDLWTPEEIIFLKEHYPDPGVSRDQLVERLGRSWHAIRLQASNLRLRRGITPSPMPLALGLIPRFDFGHAPVLVLADVHVPYQDEVWLDRVVALARAWGVRRAILAGDFYDMHELSTFEARRGHTLEQEIDVGGEVLRDLLATMEHIDYFLGNHEDRMGRQMRWKRSVRELVENELLPYDVRPHVTVHDSFTAIVNGDWWLEHPKYHGANTAVKLATRRAMNVAIAHLHRSSIQRDPSGRFYAVRIGASANHDLMPYCTRITHDLGEAMHQGALILKRGEHGRTRPYLLEPEMDLEAMQRMYGPKRRVVIPEPAHEAA